MAKTYPVKWIASTMRGAPRLSGTAGDLITVLDALLITGWGAITPTSITVADGVATVVTNVDESFLQDAVVLISGATPGALNGPTRVLTSSATGFTFATSAADGAATGTISIKYAPQGSWEKAFSATNKAVYRSTDPAGPRFYYRVDDTGTTAAQVRGYEVMTDVDTGTQPFPTTVQMANAYLHKSSIASTEAHSYFMAADSRAVLVAPEFYPVGDKSTDVRGFGDMLALVPTDAWCAAVSVSSIYSVGTYNSSFGAFTSPGNTVAGIYLARAAGGASGAVAARRVPYVGAQTAYSGNDGLMGDYPHIDASLPLSKIFLAADKTPRCDVPGVYHAPQTAVKAAFVAYQRVVVGERTFIALKQCEANRYSDSTDNARTFVDITGPWRADT